MMVRAFTAKSVEAMKPDLDKRIEVPDPALPGLYLVVQPSGAKSWAVRYRHDGKPRKLTLGRWPAVGLAAARSAASATIERVAHGEDPAAAKKTHREEVDRNTVEHHVDEFARRHLSKLRSGDEVHSAMKRFVVAKWRGKDVRKISRRDVIELLDGIVDAGKATTANRVRAYLSKFFGWLASRDVIEMSPVLGVKPPTKETSRERILSDDEIRWFWSACDRLDGPWKAAGKLLLLTGQRRREVCGMREGEIDGSLWTLPGDRTKNGRIHTVPLSNAALDALSEHHRVANPAGLIFTTTGKTPISGFRKARDRIHAEMLKVAADERGEPVAIPHWTFHDLRRTSATVMARLGQPVHVVEAVLNHVSGAISGVAGIYNRHGYDAEKKAALDAWARFVLTTASGAPAGNVIEFTGTVR